MKTRLPQESDQHKEASTLVSASGAFKQPASLQDELVQLRKDVRAFLGVFRQEVTKVREGLIEKDNYKALDALNYMDELLSFLDTQTRCSGDAVRAQSSDASQ